jgi:peroxiredoxin
MLLFVSSNCWGCTLLLPVVRVWQRDYADRLTIAVLATGTLAENQAKMAEYEVSRLLLDRKSAVADKYQARWTPAAVLIRPDGRIASPVTYGDNAIRELVRNLIASGELGSGATDSGSNGHVPQVALRYSVRAIGEPAPKFSLPDMSGRLVTVGDLLGSPTLLFFCHPLCQFCRAMRDDLRRWEEQPPAGAPKLVRIACGDEAEIRTAYTGLASPTLLDPAFDLGKLFGTKVTPSAILIDAEGKVASGLAMGEPNVRALIGLPTADREEHAER